MRILLHDIYSDVSRLCKRAANAVEEALTILPREGTLVALYDRDGDWCIGTFKVHHVQTGNNVTPMIRKNNYWFSLHKNGNVGVATTGLIWKRINGN